MKLRASSQLSHSSRSIAQVVGFRTVLAILFVLALAQHVAASSAPFRDGMVLVGFEPGVSPGGMAVAVRAAGAVDLATIGAGTPAAGGGAGRGSRDMKTPRRNTH